MRRIVLIAAASVAMTVVMLVFGTFATPTPANENPIVQTETQQNNTGMTNAELSQAILAASDEAKAETSRQANLPEFVRPASDVLTLQSTTDHEPDPASATNPYLKH